MLPNDRQQGCFAAGFGLLYQITNELPHGGFFAAPGRAVKTAAGRSRFGGPDAQ
jgi:hypothetical protein